jgi:16S rRNA (uracil1498-N3)-methyltransferase
VSLPRFFIAPPGPACEGSTIALDAAQAKHLAVRRIRTGEALELVLPGGAWRADLAELERDRALARLVAPLEEDREAPIPLHAWIPVTAQLSSLDELLPPLVELGVTRIQPVVYRRSEYDARKTAARMERWHRIVASACEQSHRTRFPELGDVLPFEAMLGEAAPQKWVAYELATGERNPVLRTGEPLAFTSGPEGGITDEEFQALRAAGWQSVSLGKAILRAVTAPLALMGAVQFQLGASSDRSR